MPKIIFTADPDLPRDIAHLNYKKGDIVMLAPDGCQKWIRRGVAKFYTEAPAPAPTPEPVAEPTGTENAAADARDSSGEEGDLAEPEAAAPEVATPRRGRRQRS